MSVRPPQGEEADSSRGAHENSTGDTRAMSGRGRDTSGTESIPKAPAPRRPRRLMRRTLIVFAALIIIGVVAFGGLLLVTPSVGNAQTLARAQDRGHHAAFPGPPVPPRFAASIEATEDHRFGYEPGIDPFAIARVTASWLTGGGTADQGGATIYQQLAKLLYTRTRTGATVELEQVSLAVKLWMTYSSQQILQMYSDVAYFGNGDYGIAAASCGYFGVPPASMSWPQAALLAGLVQGPSQDDPLQHPAQARRREVHVVGRLAATGEITQQQARAALAQPLARLVENAGDAGSRCAA
jgi:membrane peptidoglycan carboxypeptidase